MKPEEIDYRFVVIKRNIERIINIVKSLKRYSRTSSTDPMELIPLQRIADDVLEICGDAMKAANIEFKIHVETGLSIECRISEIEQVLVNLVGNSRDAIAPLKLRWIRINVWRDGEYAMISVTDSGPGIAPEIVEKLMTPFFTTKPVGIGTGLGLSISRKVIEVHQGTLQYDSTKPNTCFILKLPIRQPKSRIIEAA